MEPKKSLVQLALAAEVEKKFLASAKAMKELIKKQNCLETLEETRLFVTSYKCVVEQRRCGLQLINDLVRQLAGHSIQKVIAQRRIAIMKKIRTISTEVLWLLKTHLLPGCKHKEQKILYQLIRADFIRYKCEAAHKKLKQGLKKETDARYKAVYKKSRSYLKALHPLRQAAAINYSCFLNDIMKNTKRAVIISKKALVEACCTLPKRSIRQSKVLDTLSYNLTYWKELLENEELGVSDRKRDKSSSCTHLCVEGPQLCIIEYSSSEHDSEPILTMPYRCYKKKGTKSKLKSNNTPKIEEVYKPKWPVKKPKPVKFVEEVRESKLNTASEVKFNTPNQSDSEMLCYTYPINKVQLKSSTEPNLRSIEYANKKTQIPDLDNVEYDMQNLLNSYRKMEKTAVIHISTKKSKLPLKKGSMMEPKESISREIDKSSSIPTIDVESEDSLIDLVNSLNIPLSMTWNDIVRQDDPLYFDEELRLNLTPKAAPVKRRPPTKNNVPAKVQSIFKVKNPPKLKPHVEVKPETPIAYIIDVQTPVPTQRSSLTPTKASLNAKGTEQATTGKNINIDDLLLRKTPIYVKSIPNLKHLLNLHKISKRDSAPTVKSNIKPVPKMSPRLVNTKPAKIIKQNPKAKSGSKCSAETKRKSDIDPPKVETEVMEISKEPAPIKPKQPTKPKYTREQLKNPYVQTFCNLKPIRMKVMIPPIIPRRSPMPKPTPEDNKKPKGASKKKLKGDPKTRLRKM